METGVELYLPAYRGGCALGSSEVPGPRGFCMKEGPNIPIVTVLHP